MLDPLIISYGKGRLPGFIGDPKGIVDVVSDKLLLVPKDKVVMWRTILMSSSFFSLRVESWILVGSSRHGCQRIHSSHSKAWDCCETRIKCVPCRVIYYKPTCVKWCIQVFLRSLHLFSISGLKRGEHCHHWHEVFQLDGQFLLLHFGWNNSKKWSNGCTHFRLKAARQAGNEMQEENGACCSHG